MRVPFWTILALLVALAVTSGVACGGDSKEETPNDTGVFPTATLPAELPDVLIVSGTPQPQGGNGDRYVVQTGDTLSSIADRFGVTVDDIINANNITDPTGLHAGDELVIPSGEATPEPRDEPTAAPTTAPPDEEPTAQPTSGSTGGTTYTVQDGDNPASIAAQFGITAEELMEANGITDPTSLLVGQVLTIPGQ